MEKKNLQFIYENPDELSIVFQTFVHESTKYGINPDRGILLVAQAEYDGPILWSSDKQNLSRRISKTDAIVELRKLLEEAWNIGQTSDSKKSLLLNLEDINKIMEKFTEYSQVDTAESDWNHYWQSRRQANNLATT